jgi:nucleotide-binding universal stress UspA family protein
MDNSGSGQGTGRLRTIVAATDFSPAAATAVGWAVEIARPLGARIELVHALTLPLPTEDMVRPGPDFLDQLERAATETLGDEVRKLRAQGIDVTPILRLGQPSQVIVDLAQALPADLVVVGTRGFTGLRHLLLGSTAQRVVHHAPCPVLSVHPDSVPPRPISTILVPTDFSEDAQLAAHTAHRLLAHLEKDARLILLHAYHLPIEYTAYGPIPMALDFMKDAGFEAEERLADAAEPLRREGLDVTTVAREGFPPDIIAEEARKHGVDLVAMGTHGRTGLRHLLLGSTAERVIRGAPCPVLTVRAAAT